MMLCTKDENFMNVSRQSSIIKFPASSELIWFHGKVVSLNFQQAINMVSWQSSIIKFPAK